MSDVESLLSDFFGGSDSSGGSSSSSGSDSDCEKWMKKKGKKFVSKRPYYTSYPKYVKEGKLCHLKGQKKKFKVLYKGDASDSSDSDSSSDFEVDDTAAPANTFAKEAWQEAPTVTDEQKKVATEALLEEVSQHCCWGGKPVEEMEITKYLSMKALRYEMKAFTESRYIYCKYERFSNKKDLKKYKKSVKKGKPQNKGDPKEPWADEIGDQTLQPFKMFEKEKLNLKVPNTRHVVQCHRCVGRGKVPCHLCHGSGRRRVYRDEEFVEEKCPNCDSKGRVFCAICGGLRLLKHIIWMKIKFKNRKNMFIHEETVLPDKLIAEAKGNKSFEGEGTIEDDCNFFQDQLNSLDDDWTKELLKDKCAKMLQKQRTKWPDKKVHCQRHTLNDVPVVQVDYTYDSKYLQFFMYGRDHRVWHADPGYPASCCWGCSIL